jgi:glycerol-1-phosphate dehydrogenase [NAD(P)+]
VIAPIVPVDLDALRQYLGDGPAGSGLHPIGLRAVTIGQGALDELVPTVLRLVPPGASVVVLVDATPMRRGARDLKAHVRTLLEARFQVRVEVLGRDRPELHADEAASAEADRAIEGAACVVTVGSGTVTDLGKDSSHRAGGIPFVVVQTAVSVNAFSDDMAVLLRNGVKRTVPSRWPSALIVDLETIGDAPPEMNRAGFGELISMFTAPADWYLASAIGMDDAYDERVVRLFGERASQLLAIAPGVAEHRYEALAELAGFMTLTGIAMGAAGRTAPLSGMEHTVSHLLDMAAEGAGRPLAFHGAQVGAAAAVVSITWRRFLRRFDPASLRAESAYPSAGQMEPRVRAAFRELDPTGRVGDECWRDYAQKLDRWTVQRAGVEQFIRDWPHHRAAMEGILATPEAIADALHRAGAPARFRDLNPPADGSTVRWALGHCHLMRNRFTVADLAYWTGHWDGAAVEDVLAEAAGMGVGL